MQFQRRRISLSLPIKPGQDYYLPATNTDRLEEPEEAIAQQVMTEYGTAHLPVGTQYRPTALAYLWLLRFQKQILSKQLFFGLTLLILLGFADWLMQILTTNMPK